MDVAHKKILHDSSTTLFESFEPIDLLPYLMVQELISDEEVSRVREEKERRFRVADLISVVQKRMETLEPFIEALDKCGYAQIAESLNDAVLASPAAVPSPVDKTPPKRRLRFDIPSSEMSTPPPDPSFLDDSTSPGSAGARVSRLRQFFEARQSRAPSEADLSFLIAHTDFPETQIRQWLREFLDSCPTGRLSKKEFAKFYKQIDPTFLYTDRYCEHVFRCFDRDGSGFIDFKEFLIALNVKRSGSAHQKLDWTFRLYDVDGNGVIDRSELAQITQTLFDMLGEEGGVEFDAGECAAIIFDKMDTDGDGQVTRTEFVRGCLEDEALFNILTSASTID